MTDRPAPYQIDPQFVDRFGRVREFDPASEQFPMRRRIAAAFGTERPRFAVRRRHYQRPPRAYTQRGGTCVGHGMRWKLDCGPFMLGTGRWYAFTPTGPDPYAIYTESCKHDVWPQNDAGDLHFGTSVLAAAKACQKVLRAIPPRHQEPIPLVGEYTWAWEIQPVIDHLLGGLGCVVIGVDWYEGMLETDAEGFLHATGRVVGGHCVCLDGVDLGKVGTDSEPILFGTNSWGDDSWGFHGNSVQRGKGAGGRFKMAASALNPLLAQDRWGEALTAIELPRPGRRVATSRTDADAYEAAYREPPPSIRIG